MRKVLLMMCAAVWGLSTQAQEVPQLGKASIEEVIHAMTTEEKISLLVGTGMAGVSGDNAVVGETQSLVPGAAGTTQAIPRLGIPAIVMADGPAGVRISPARPGEERTFYCTAFPVGTLIASTWNTELVEEVGKAMGNEVREYGIDILLAPALNIHRNPLCGRNFEYYSEDPLISGKITAAMVKGVQSNQVGTSIKHFAVNNQETNRTGNDAQLTPRALREIYLKGFEIAIKESAPWTVMSSYNKINGTYASESRPLLTGILRDEWKFNGIVMTDWFGGKSPVAQMHAGNDLLMPGTQQQQQVILEAVNSGTLSIEDIDTNVKRMLELILQTPRFKDYAYSNAPDLKKHAEITRQSASEGMVLLKNEGHTLPFQTSIKNIAVFGTTSYDFIAGGTGSGDVNEAYTVSLVEGLENSEYTLDRELTTLYTNYREAEEAKRLKDDNPFMHFFNKPRIPEFVPEPSLVDKKARETDIALITLGRSSGEFTDRVLPGDFELTAEEKNLITSVTEAFRQAGKKTVVILNIGGVIETASWKEIPDAILLAWQAGQEGGNSVVDILSGKVNPSGKLTMTFPVHYMDASSSQNFPYDQELSMQDILSSFAGGEKDPHKEPIRNVDYTIYEEGIFVGYRFFDIFQKEVSYPFGYGLSYTTFDYSGIRTEEKGDHYEVQVTIRNTGEKAGKEVVQLYVAAPAEGIIKPEKELKAFTKTKELNPGESQTVTLPFSKNDLASFHEASNSWITDTGTYRILIGNSSRDIRQQQTVTLHEAITVEQVQPLLFPQHPIQEYTERN
ncbi:MAG: glycoside hydrolase family 3 C-terminal domain-containing protein [Tannerellaceae bacterium]|nr:glycoside hydrolase family 3 C-terminal domain-containing protein [Tannerellaceae bacterium]